MFFRPLLGWARAWSFDRLRLWIEKGILPETSREKAFTYALSRLTIAFIWFYHGLIPKLITRNPDELRMLRDAGIAGPDLLRMLKMLGVTEILFALILVIFWKSRWPLWFTVAGVFMATLGVAITSPSYLTGAFNPLTLNIAVATLAIIGLLSAKLIPTASNCLRKPVENER